MYQVLARKWRPKSFDELVGQKHIARALTNAIEADRVAHAYIFAGVRGIGKTTVARILAKCLNCEKGPTADPCHECEPCREIAEGRSMDVLELDAASRRGIDSIRELQEVVSYAPVRDRFRILILDEFHMLTKEAFNALLKTLEEPPPQVVFVLATTEIQKILPTILSRCQVFEFRRVTGGDVAAHLRRLCDAEKIEISDPALDRIAWAGEGSVRDSLSVLERVLAFCGNRVGDDEALQVLGAVRHEVLEDLVRALSARDAAAMLGVLDGLVADGHDLVHFWGEWIAAMRDLLLLRVDPSRTGTMSRTPEQAEALMEASEGLSRDDLLRAFQILADLERGLKSSSQPRFLFEATIVRLASLGSVRPIEEILGRLEAGDTGPSGSGGTRGSTSGRGAGRSSPGAARQKKKEPEAAPLRPAPAAPPPAPARAKPTPGSPDFMPAFLAAVHAAKPMLGAMLEEADGASVEDDTLVLRFSEAADSIRKQLDRKDFRKILAKCASEAAGRELRVRGTAETGTAPSEERATIEKPEAAPEVPAPPPPRPSPGSRRSAPEPGVRDDLLRRATNEPGIKKLLHEFGAHVVDIRPLEAPGELADEGGETEPGQPEDSR